MKHKLILGDCIEKMKDLPSESVDAVITDPPYGISFMSMDWDNPDKRRNEGRYEKIGHERAHISKGVNYVSGSELRYYQEWTLEWATEAFRVLKKGGWLLSFGGTRTYHRLACGIEDAGFEIKDTLLWGYLSGFPKAQDLAMMISKREGSKREGLKQEGAGSDNTESLGKYAPEYKEMILTENAKKWQGWKTPALKPAYEPIVMAQKPPDRTLINNIEKHGIGGINIEGNLLSWDNYEDYLKWENNRRGMAERSKLKRGDKTTEDKVYYSGWKKPEGLPPIMTREEFERARTNRLPYEDENDYYGTQIGYKQGDHSEYEGNWKVMQGGTEAGRYPSNIIRTDPFGDGLDKFFLIPKASKGEKEEGLDDKADRNKNNIHPTVKPLRLMEKLINLFVPHKIRDDCLILDPFMGSGTTLIAAKKYNVNAIGIEKELEYFKIAEARIRGKQKMLVPFEVEIL